MWGSNYYGQPYWGLNFYWNILTLRTYTEAVSVADSITRSLVKILSDAVSLTEVIVRSSTKALVDTVSVVEGLFKRYLNGVFIRWDKVAKPTTTFTKAEKPTATYTKIEKPTATWAKVDKPET